ncbi:hypothetical protein CDAR_558421 [Caerostris darwini]|uniref:Uncharacterized protein n=1 Tax=Caerostris darwini TaxID=1538125 RepID=A0AAV4UNK7_9ARAC|nr:hypothetical protein CDAR_558421 [Caerostris darwini]
MEEMRQRDKIIKVKIKLVKGVTFLEQATNYFYQFTLCNANHLKEVFGGNTEFDNALAKVVSQIENVEYLLLFVHARMTDTSYKPGNEEALIYPWAQNDLRRIREEFVHLRDCIFFLSKTVKNQISTEN